MTTQQAINEEHTSTPITSHADQQRPPVLMFLAKAFQTDPRPRQESKALTSARYPVYVFAWDRDREFRNRETVDGAIVESFHPLGLKGSSPLGLALGAIVFQLQLIFSSVRLIRNLKQRPIVHAHDFNTLVLGCMLRILRLSRSLVYDSHELSYAAYRELYNSQVGLVVRAVEQLCLRYADSVITVSLPFAKYLHRFNRNTEVIHNCPAESELSSMPRLAIREQLGLPLHAFIVSYVGSIRHDCNMDLFLSVAALANDHSNVHFVVVGGGILAPSFRHTASKINASMTILPQMPRKTALAYVAASDLTWAIYHPDSVNMKLTLPWKFFESLACGVPLLVAGGTLMARLTRDLGCGVIVQDQDPNVVLSRILTLAKETSSQQKMSSCAGIAAQTFTWQTVSRKLVNIYDRLSS